MKLKSDVDQMESEQLTLLSKQEDKISRNISELTQRICDLRKLLSSNDVWLISEYKSRNSEFEQVPSKLKVILPNLCYQKINTKELLQQFGILSKPSVTTEDGIYTLESTGVKSSPSDRPLLNIPQIVTAYISSQFGLP